MTKIYRIHEVKCPNCWIDTVKRVCPSCGAQFGGLISRHSGRKKIINDLPLIKDALPCRIAKVFRSKTTIITKICAKRNHHD